MTARSKCHVDSGRLSAFNVTSDNGPGRRRESVLLHVGLDF
jgi:hypothetical protein